LQKGWQRKSLFAAFNNPLAAPYLPTASLAYSEQLGENLQAGGNAARKYC
jgi:hypothetical protein